MGTQPAYNPATKQPVFTPSSNKPALNCGKCVNCGGTLCLHSSASIRVQYAGMSGTPPATPPIVQNIYDAWNKSYDQTTRGQGNLNSRIIMELFGPQTGCYVGRADLTLPYDPPATPTAPGSFGGIYGTSWKGWMTVGDWGSPAVAALRLDASTSTPCAASGTAGLLRVYLAGGFIYDTPVTFTSWSLTITGNNCCKDGDGNCHKTATDNCPDYLDCEEFGI